MSVAMFRRWRSNVLALVALRIAEALVGIALLSVTNYLDPAHGLSPDYVHATGVLTSVIVAIKAVAAYYFFGYWFIALTSTVALSFVISNKMGLSMVSAGGFATVGVPIFLFNPNLLIDPYGIVWWLVFFFNVGAPFIMSIWMKPYGEIRGQE
jgi:hypothetical protein